MTTQPAYRRKLIEVDLPLAEINRESAREKSIRHGHPSTLHLWWARRPLAACRAVIFASMVDDPSACPEEFPVEEDQRAERGRLHELIKRLVVWENSSDANLLAEARYEIARSVARSHGEPPPDKDSPAAVLEYLNCQAQPIYDPFCGGGSIPLEAQRLGMRAVGSDLNPVAVLITKALIELPPKFANRPPVNPEADPMGLTTGKGKRQKQISWRGAAGLADDIRYYGRKMREMAWERIGQLYPQVKLPDGGEATVIAWLWARTVPCPNPACGVAMPLLRTFQVSKKRGNEHWTKPLVDRAARTVSFVVQNHNDGVPAEGTVNRNGATCVACGSVSPLAYVREQSRAGHLGEVMTTIVAEGDRKRLFVSPNEDHIQDGAVSKTGMAFRWSSASKKCPLTAYCKRYVGTAFEYWHELFTKRQLTALTTLQRPDSKNVSSMTSKQRMLKRNTLNAVLHVLGIWLSEEIRTVILVCNIWQNLGDFVAQVFTRQALSMIWDFAESNNFSGSTQNWMAQIDWVAKVVEQLPENTNYGSEVPSRRFYHHPHQQRPGYSH